MRNGLERLLVAALSVALVTVTVLSIGHSMDWFGTSPAGGSTPAGATAGVRPIATGLRIPWGVAFLPDDTALVTERGTGRILSVSRDGRVTEVQRVAEAVSRGEGGLLGIAVSPSYASDGLLYVYYTTATDNRVARFRLGQPPVPILTGLPAASWHNGGRIAFGPDRMLYVATGDAARPDRAQDREYLGGKILRMTGEGQPAPGNPFGTLVWSLGHRNVQGLAWDSRGRLFASEFGQNDFDEVNLIEPGRNYGWPIVEGTGTDPAFTNPITTWAPTSQASPSGIAVHRDLLYVACLAGQRLYRLGLDGTGSEALLLREYGRLRDVVAAPDGSLWLLTSNRDGRGAPDTTDDRILRFTPQPQGPA